MFIIKKSKLAYIASFCFKDASPRFLENLNRVTLYTHMFMISDTAKQESRVSLKSKSISILNRNLNLTIQFLLNILMLVHGVLGYTGG